MLLHGMHVKLKQAASHSFFAERLTWLSLGVRWTDGLARAAALLSCAEMASDVVHHIVLFYRYSDIRGRADAVSKLRNVMHLHWFRMQNWAACAAPSDDVLIIYWVCVARASYRAQMAVPMLPHHPSSTSRCFTEQTGGYGAAETVWATWSAWPSPDCRRRHQWWLPSIL